MTEKLTARKTQLLMVTKEDRKMLKDKKRFEDKKMLDDKKKLP